MEQRENNIRLRELRGWHLLTGSCGQCGHRSQMDVRFVAGAAETIAEFERWLVCAKCGNRVTIIMASR